jgi:sugar phosphate isomerase/epimerase
VTELGVELVYASVTARGRPFFEKLEAAADAGFTGMSVSMMDYRAALAEGRSDADVVAAVGAAGVEITAVGGVTRWLDGSADDDERLAMNLAARFACGTVNCTATNAPYRGLDAAVAAFAAVCDRAADRGLRCRLEFVPWTGVGDLATAWDVVRLAGRGNGGLLIDNWHLERSGGTFDDLRIVPPEHLFGVQLSDAPAEPADDGLATESMARLLPGEGDLDVVGFVRAIEALGASAPYEAEPINPRWDELPASVGMPLVRQAMADVIAAGRASPAG